MSRKTYLYFKIIGLSVLLISIVIGAMFIFNSKNLLFGFVPFNISTGNAEPLEEPEIFYFDDIDKINIELATIPVIIVEKDIDQIKVTSTINVEGTGPRLENPIYKSNNTLHVKQEITMGVYSSAGELLIEVPNGIELDYELNLVSEDLYIDAKINKLELNVVSLEAKIYQAAKDIKINDVSGSIYLVANEDTKDIDINTVSSDINIQVEGSNSFNIDNESISGDIENNYGNNNEAINEIDISVNSVSGDVILDDWK